MKINSARRPFLWFLLIASFFAIVSGPAFCLETAEVTVRESGENRFIIDFEAPVPTFGWNELEGDLYDVVKMAGCESVGEPGRPDLPFLGFLLAVPSECEPSAYCVSAQDEEFLGFQVAPSLRFVKVEVGETIAIEPRFELDEEQYNTEAYFPNSIVEAEYFGVFRGQPLIRVMVYPVRFNPVSGSLKVVRRATFTVDFERDSAGSRHGEPGVLYSEIGPSWRMVDAVKSCVANPGDVQPILVRDVPQSQYTPVPLANGFDEYKFAISEDGIYKITGSELAAAGIAISTVVPANIGMRNLGQDVAIFVEDGGNGSFDEADYLLFWGEAPDSEFTPQETGLTEFRISGFSSDEIVVFDVTDSLAVRNLTNVSVAPDGGGFAVSFQDNTSPDRRYVVAQRSVFRAAPSFLADVPSSLMSAENRADYIIISHANFIESAEGIAQHHAAKGVAVFVADVEDVYDEFNFGVKSPQAIKDFLKYAYESFSAPPPVDVLLVGDADIDYKNRDGSEIDYVPTHIFNDPGPNRMGQGATDNWFVCVDGEDVLPDMNIGRICAKRSSDVDNVLAKVQAYDNRQASGDWLYDVLFVAGDVSENVNVNRLLSMFYLPDEYEDTHVNYNDYGSAEEARLDIIANLNDGCLLVNYSGHGNINRWAKNLFSSSNVATLENGDMMPFVITLTCLNGFFPHLDGTACMGDVFMRTAGKGAIASWAPTGVESASNHQILASGLGPRAIR